MIKDQFNKRYIDLILQNHQQIQPLKSCEFKKRNKLETKLSLDMKESNYSNNQLPSTNNNKIFFISDQPKNSLGDQSKIDLIKNKVKKQDSEKLIDMIHQKNEQIASALLKQKKSLSDVIYSNGSIANIKTKRYLDKNGKGVQEYPFVQRGSDILYPKRTNFPKINKLVIEDEKDRHNSSGSIRSQGSKQKQKIVKQANLKFEEVNNPYIQNFLRLKQQAYNTNKFREDQELKMRKKKLQNHKKQLAKKQKERVKNSLEQYLQTKIIPKQDCRYKSLGSHIKQSKKLKNFEEAIIEMQDELLKKNQKVTSFKKKSNKVGTKTKISNKYLFHDSEATIYQNKIKLYRDFLFLINLSYKVYDPISIQELSGNMKTQQKYKFYVGKGNNSRLIRALLKRRFWWTEVEDPREANFVWTQLKQNNFYQYQKVSSRRSDIYEDDENLNEKKHVKKDQTKKGIIFRAPLPEHLQKFLINKNINAYKQFLKQTTSSTVNNENKYQNFGNRLKFFPSLTPRDEDARQCRMHNHFQYNYLIGNKKALFYNLKDYYELIGENVFNIIPLTFHIGDEGTSSKVFEQFLKYFKQFKKNKSIKNVWIIKPGQNTNRGKGITVVDELYEISKILHAKNKNPQDKRTYIIQKYIERPLLYKGRKFDIRHFMLATKMYGKMRLYWFGEGYIRTSSYDYDIQDIADEMIHLTNDAIQKQSYEYGKYQQGNKVSYSELQRYFDFTYPNRKYSITEEMYPQMKEIALKAFKACYLNMDLDNTEHNFEIFGLDFMLDSSFKMYLIEVNTNPCLQMNGNLLNRVIPQVIEHTLRLTIDPIFPPPFHYPNTQKHYVPDTQRLQYQLIFDEGRDGRQIQQLYRHTKRNEELLNVEEDQQTFENDGKQVQIQIE